MKMQKLKEELARAFSNVLADKVTLEVVNRFVGGAVDKLGPDGVSSAALLRRAKRDKDLGKHFGVLKGHEDEIAAACEGAVRDPAPLPNPLPVELRRPGDGKKDDVKHLVEWVRARTAAMSYEGFDSLLRSLDQPRGSRHTNEAAAEVALGEQAAKVATHEVREELASFLRGSRAYEILSELAQAFLRDACRQGQDPGSSLETYLGNDRFNYVSTLLKGLSTKHRRTAFGDGVVADAAKKFAGFCPAELIWSYWHEEGMLVQTMNAISLRFQNVRSESGGRDPLAELEIDPLRPLNNLLWGYIQDERNRLTVRRRAYEYDHHYGLRLIGKAVRNLRPADTRSRFLEAFHNLLLLCSRFYRDQTFTTVEPDASPILHALRELHLVLAAGAHNQFGDLPWQARVEMLVQMWLLGRPEMREFLRGRVMVPYEEPWMGRVDAMKRLQGWVDPSISEFHRLARFGEQIVLTVRYANWNQIDDKNAARTWATLLQTEVQSYIHSYRAVTGIDLGNDRSAQDDQDPRFLVPAHHLRRRTAEQSRSAVDEGDL